MPAAPIARYHSLDALRAAMMLLGLVLHSAASYTRTPLGAGWPIHDAQTSAAFDLLVFFIHLFRMPVFFVAAGFFGALLCARDGAAGLARNRASRVLLPLIVFWIVVPLAGLGIMFSVRQTGGEMPWDGISGPPFWRRPLLGHLWFLYYLVLFYCAAIALAALAARLGNGAVRRIDGAFRTVATRWWGALLLGAVTTMTLVPMEVPGIETAPSLVPPARVLLAYFVFFGAGWLLFRHRDIVPSLGARWERPLALGVAASVGYLFVTVAQTGFTDAKVWHLTAIALAGPAIWLLIFGVVGFFVRYLETPRPVIRYLSDASYWMYLTHLVPAAWIPGVLADVTAPALVKFGIVVGSTTLCTVATYHVLVRSTAIGALLNGRRYPRSWAVPAPARSADLP